MSNKEHFNLKRKIFHLIGLIIPVIFFFDIPMLFNLNIFKNDTRSFLFYILIFLTLFMLFIEFMRFQFSSWQKIFLKITAPLLKKDETDKVHGSLPFIASSALIVGFLPKEIAVLSFLFLLAGDPAAAYAGSRFGTIRFKNGKSIQGTAAAAIVCFVSGLIFLLFLSMNNNLNKEAYNLYLIKQGIINYKAFIVILTGAISAALLELISRRGFLDDNLIVPIGSGLFMTLLTAFLYNKSFSQIFYSIFDLLIPF